MPHTLRNDLLELQIYLPTENYVGSRFDWTGKITTVTFNKTAITGVERTDIKAGEHMGKGFYNEFGIDSPLGFEGTEIGDWFHKIGVGLIRKDSDTYDFQRAYEVQPAEFKVTKNDTKISITCTSRLHNDYGYVLHKEIELLSNGFRIGYRLRNTGKKCIETSEYNHNFLKVDKDLIGCNYHLKFSFSLQPDHFGETVNPERKVVLGKSDFSFLGTPKEQFFFSNLSGGQSVPAQWELLNNSSKIGIRETGNFPTHSINLWGWTHVISPELFHSISLQAGQVTEWTRTYEVFSLQ
ncbi:hypothetical protein SB49_01335 [Sediminicola sp. YIK13]|uniref:hypothetical protein n=1 Tax=Sediminicola sp. YIK13 TaxID=1453352 RepID=UPI000721EEEC|nr:hypothetical protein [Sediminicola sp. YIK13]ALM06605.1 hypothetical protein SB49_01335 [Sediminicola sp. YIK13]